MTEVIKLVKGEPGFESWSVGHFLPALPLYLPDPVGMEGHSVCGWDCTESLPSEDVSLCSGSSLCPWATLRTSLLAGGKMWRGCCLSHYKKEMRDMRTCRALHRQQNKSLPHLWPGELCISGAVLPQHGTWSPARWPVNFLTIRE